MNGFYAHTPNEANQWHELDDHLLGVARRAQEFAREFGVGSTAYWLGLAHDIGKFSEGFQSYLRALYTLAPEKHPARGPDHSSAGAVLAQLATRNQGLATIIAGHHGQLASAPDIDARLNRMSMDEAVHQALDRARDHFPQVADVKSVELFELANTYTPLQLEMLYRFLFSSLVDADYLDTEEHFTPEKAHMRQTAALDLDALASRFFKTYQDEFAHVPASMVNKIRNEVFVASVNAAAKPPGVFRLTVPTGGGKTLASLAFALEHAKKHDLRRIVVAIPFTSIIEQTARTYRTFLGNEAVLEHHSMLADAEDSDMDPEALRRRLAMENWDAPVVVTTTVQLFDSLFSNRPGRVRKLHRLARSVLVIDEVQSLPSGYIAPILDGLQELVKTFGATVVLSSATQPEYAAVATSPNDKPVEIVPNYRTHFELLRRVRYEWDDRKWTWSEIAAYIQGQKQILVIVNTRRDARQLLDEVSDLDHVYHLSTDLCPAHRMDVLKVIRKRLQKKKPVRLISTQVVEAGVDISFPVVMRAVGPLPSMIQAAGRCNREGEAELGTVVLFEPEDGGLPRGDYPTATAEALQLLRQGKDLNDPDLVRTYFRRFYMAVDPDEKQIQKLRKRFNYPEVAKRFRLIDDHSEPVLVRYVSLAERKRNEQSPEIDRLLSKVRHAGLSRRLMRRLNLYMVNMRPIEFSEAQNKGLIQEIASGLYLWQGGYDWLGGKKEHGLDAGSIIV